jgi:uncharacterized SAM-binding protein YcdF (DUF218 family)
MMFVASKLLAFALQPLFLVFILLLLGLLVWPRRPRLGRGLAWAALLALVASTWTPIPVALMHRLESRYPAPPEDLDLRAYAGVVVLGGALSDSALWETHGKVALNEQAERMTEAVALARLHPHLKLLFTGGNASVVGRGLPEANRARMYFDRMGVPPAQVQYEGQSRNTAENAQLSARLPGVDKQARWLLLTSANHMPRSMGVFLKAGWNVTPYPVDYRSTGQLDWLDFSLSSGPDTWHTVLHETLGYYVYRWFGQI